MNGSSLKSPLPGQRRRPKSSAPSVMPSSCSSIAEVATDGQAVRLGARAVVDAEAHRLGVPVYELLGGKQMQFLEDWLSDWDGARMKAVISQTIFTGMATTHGGERQVLRMDYDQNGWPQKARNAALRVIRKAHAFHIAGDQHLPAVVHYGIDEPRDAGVAFAGPAVNVGYPRWWEPTEKVNARKPGQGLTGDFIDHFGHPMAVLAVKNGEIEPRIRCRACNAPSCA